MPTLTIHRGPQTASVTFTGPEKLSSLLDKAGYSTAHPCGGRGICGKCAVMLTGNSSSPNSAEERCGARLSCQAVILGDAEVILPQAHPMMQIEGGSSRMLTPVHAMPGQYGAAIDVGTTTLALQLYDLHTGRCLACTSMLNPQTGVAADVIGRIDAALHGGAEQLRTGMEAALEALLHTAAAQAGVPSGDVESLVITGNTTMLYLLTGRSPESLSHAPFAADHLFGTECSLLGRRCYLPPCLHAFVGADTACALLASAMPDQDETALLCDIGTNGEIALRHKGQLYIASTAAGPAFEGAGVSCGCGSIPGAIDRVDVTDEQLHIRTIAGETPAGLCGSGLVDVIAALLKLEIIDETGAMEDHIYPLAPGVTLTQQDVRAVQLAKAAIAAGTASLLQAAGCSVGEVRTMYLAGGFGSHLSISSAAAIGLILPELADKIQVIGNAALDGAALLLTDTTLRSKLTAMQQSAHHVRLDGNPYFSQRYVEEMLFAQ
ncbi:MAG: DUF4445 domain-containing protein [Clostridia bacterium]|nr:DUF4445 domain-containing protein [Clostridia bacterium]